MSKWLEHIKLLPKGLKNPGLVIEGHLNNLRLELGTLPEDQEAEIVRRRLICSQCPFMSKNAEQLTGFKTDRTEEFCTLCSCPIKSKTASLASTCGIDYYNKKHPDKPLDVKWLPYDTKN